MFTPMIPVCHLQACVVLFSGLNYETEEGCRESQATTGIYHLRQNYPDADFIEFYCHEWVGPDKGTPA